MLGKIILIRRQNLLNRKCIDFGQVGNESETSTYVFVCVKIFPYVRFSRLLLLYSSRSRLRISHLTLQEVADTSLVTNYWLFCLTSFAEKKVFSLKKARHGYHITDPVYLLFLNHSVQLFCFNLFFRLHFSFWVHRKVIGIGNWSLYWWILGRFDIMCKKGRDEMCLSQHKCRPMSPAPPIQNLGKKEGGQERPKKL